VGERKRERER
jgi:hypothetical protein